MQYKIKPRWPYLALLAWQGLWLWLAPEPYGYQRMWLGLLFTGFLAIPFYGIWLGRRSWIIWGAYLSLMPFIFALMEIYARPAARWGGLIQLAIIACYWWALGVRFRRP